MKDGEELLHEPFQRLVEQEQLLAYKYDGFWAAMDTFKDKQMLDDIYASGRAPWQVWNHSSTGPHGQPSRGSDGDWSHCSETLKSWMEKDRETYISREDAKHLLSKVEGAAKAGDGIKMDCSQTKEINQKPSFPLFSPVKRSFLRPA